MSSQDAFEGLTGSFRHADAFWRFANDLSERFTKAEQELDPERTTAGLTVIVFAALSVETFFNEIPSIAAAFADDRQALAVRETLLLAEESHGSPSLKLASASLALGRLLTKEEQPYQDLALLARVRNEIVHPKSYQHRFMGGRVEAQPKKLLQQLFARRLIQDPTLRPAQSFFSMIATDATGRWAVDVARRVIRYVVDLLPEGDFKRRLRMDHSSALGSDLGELM